MLLNNSSESLDGKELKVPALIPPNFEPLPVYIKYKNKTRKNLNLPEHFFLFNGADKSYVICKDTQSGIASKEFFL